MSHFKHFYLPILCVITIVIVITFGVDLLYRQEYNLSYSIAKNIFPNKPINESYKLVTLGNSHTQSGISFGGYNIKGLNLSRGGQRLTYDLALLRQHKAQIDPNAVIIINASPISFSHSNVFDKGSYGESYYESLSPIFIPQIKLGKYVEKVLLPFVQSGYKWRKQYNSDLIDKRSAIEKAQFEGSIDTELTGIVNEVVPNASAPAKDNTYNVERINKLLLNRVYRPDLFIDSTHGMYSKWLATDEFSPRYFKQNRKDLEKIIRYVEQQGWKPLLITIPISHDLKVKLGDKYFQIYLYDQIKSIKLNNTEYLDFTNEYNITKNTSYFANSDHLNTEGSIVFSYILLQNLIDKGYLESSVDNYTY